MVRFGLILMLVTGVAAGVSSASIVTINDVPSYIWYNGCGPTSAGMIMGYWDAHGYDNLIPGSNSWDTNQQAVKDMIASPGNIRDYVPTPDRVATVSDPYHADDSVADFMWASRGSLAYGASYENLPSVGMMDYMAYRGYTDASGYFVYYGSAWGELVDSINSRRPAEFFVDSDANGSADHFVAVVGYDDTPGKLKYAALNTDDHDLHWYDFVPVKSGQSYGVRSGTFFDPGSALPLHPGDANKDGAVDVIDLGVLAMNYDIPIGATWAMGDFSGDGAVDVIDLGVLAMNYDWAGVPAGAVPEPASLSLLALGSLALLRRKSGYAG